MKQIVNKPSLNIFLISLLIFVSLQYKQAVTNYTTRFVDFAQYMLQHGVTLFPMLGVVEPYPDYTITNTFIVYLLSLPFGKLSLVTLGMPYCITSALTMVFTYKLGALHDKKWGLYSVFFSLLTWSFITETRLLALDIYPTFITVLCFYLAYSAQYLQDESRLKYIYLALIVGFLFRGPMGLTTPAIVVASYYLVDKQWQRLIWFAINSGLMLLTCTGLLLGAAYLQGGQAFVQHVFAMQLIGRLINNHKPGYYFYFTNGLATYLVTVIIALTVICKKYKQISASNTQSDNKLLLHLTVWFIVIIIFYTIPYSKRARYILPITPAIALLAAYIFVEKDHLFTKTKQLLLKFCLTLPNISVVLTLAVFSYEQYIGLALQPNYLASMVSFITLALTSYFVKKYYATQKNYELLIMIFGTISFLALNAFLLYPIFDHLDFIHEDTPKFLPYWPW